MKWPTPITAAAVSTAKAIEKPIRRRLASDGLRRRPLREYACAAMGDEATGRADGSATPVDGIDAAGMEAWFEAHVPGARAPLACERTAGALPTLTSGVTAAAVAEWALRRPPLGKTLSSAHDMG